MIGWIRRQLRVVGGRLTAKSISRGWVRQESFEAVLRWGQACQRQGVQTEDLFRALSEKWKAAEEKITELIKENERLKREAGRAAWCYRTDLLQETMFMLREAVGLDGVSKGRVTTRDLDELQERCKTLAANAEEQVRQSEVEMEGFNAAENVFDIEPIARLFYETMWADHIPLRALPWSKYSISDNSEMVKSVKAVVDHVCSEAADYWKAFYQRNVGDGALLDGHTLVEWKETAIANQLAANQFMKARDSVRIENSELRMENEKLLAEVAEYRDGASAEGGDEARATNKTLRGRCKQFQGSIERARKVLLETEARLDVAEANLRNERKGAELAVGKLKHRHQDEQDALRKNHEHELHGVRQLMNGMENSEVRSENEESKLRTMLQVELERREKRHQGTHQALAVVRAACTKLEGIVSLAGAGPWVTNEEFRMVNGKFKEGMVALLEIKRMDSVRLSLGFWCNDRKVWFTGYGQIDADYVLRMSILRKAAMSVALKELLEESEPPPPLAGIENSEVRSENEKNEENKQEKTLTTEGTGKKELVTEGSS